MTAPITAARTGGASFRLLGVPVTVHVTFLVVIALLGFGVGGIDRLVVWAVVATLSVLLHELGHALVGRAAGLTPRIDLAGFGGVTSWAASPRGELGRGWSLAISLAGPGVGFLGGAVALVLGAPCCGVPVDGGLGAFAAGVWLFASFGWGVLNLLPILPLDGGQALREVLPGDRRTRLVRAAVVGVVVGGALTLWALTSGQTYLALLAGWITWNNVQQVRAAREATGPAAVGLEEAATLARDGDLVAAAQRAGGVARGSGDARRRTQAAVAAVQWLVEAGEHRAAYRAAADPRPDVDLPAALRGPVLGLHPDHGTLAGLARTWAATEDADAVTLAAGVLTTQGEVTGATDLLVPRVTDVPAGLLYRTVARARALDDPATAHRLGSTALRAGVRHAWLTFATACAAARLGRDDEAVQLLRLALRGGFADLDLLAREPDLAGLHDHPAWPALVRGDATTDVAPGT